MDAIAPTLHAFYSPQLPEAQRRTLHDRLLSLLTSDQCIEAADGYIVQWTSKLSVEAITRDASVVHDPLVLHYALHAIETRIRTAFDNTDRNIRELLLKHLVDFVIALHAWNRLCATCNSSPSDIALSQRLSIPAYVGIKAARVVVEIGKRQWIYDQNSSFPRLVLGLTDQNGHLAMSLPRIFGGMLILTTLVDDALDVSRSDMRSAQRSLLSKRILSIADKIVAALEVGLRIRCPGFPNNVPASAARSIGNITRVVPVVASESAAILRRCVVANACDQVGAECLAVLADLYGESKIPLADSWEASLSHVSGLLESVAMGDTARGNDEHVILYRKRLAGYAESLLCRCIVARTNSALLERTLNGLMGVAIRWAGECPCAFPDALDAWINIVEAIEDADVDASPLLETAYGAVARLCLDRCMHSTNGAVLANLDAFEDDAAYDDSVQSQEISCSFRYLRSSREEEPDMLSEVGGDPLSLSSMAFMTGGFGEDQPSFNGNMEETTVSSGEVESILLEDYVSKCVDALVCAVRAFPGTIGIQAAEKVCAMLNSDVSAQSVAAEALEDLSTAVTIAFSIAPMISEDSDSARAFLRSATIRLVQMRSSGGSFANQRYFLRLLRLATAVCPSLGISNWTECQSIFSTLMNLGREIVQMSARSNSVRVAASMMLLALGRICHPVRMMPEPPILPTTIALMGNRVIASLGIVGVASWALNALEQTPEVRHEEFTPRVKQLTSCCSIIFEDFIAASLLSHSHMNLEIVAKLSRGAFLMRVLFRYLGAKSTACREAVWTEFGQRLFLSAAGSLRTLSKFASETGDWDEDRKIELFHSMGIFVGSIGCSLHVFRRQIARENSGLTHEVIGCGLEAVKHGGHARLGRALLLLLREELGDGFSKEKEHLVVPAMDLALRSLEGDADVAIAAVSVLGEALNRHWLLFWPGDTAAASVNIDISKMGGTSTSLRGYRPQVFQEALRALLRALGSTHISLSRASMLTLERLDASRKLYSRGPAFREIGGTITALGGCLRAMIPGISVGENRMTTNIVADEAASIIWGVASVDWAAFYGVETTGKGAGERKEMLSTCKGALQVAVEDLRICTLEQISILVHEFGNPTDRPTFLRCLSSLTNDISFCSSVNQGPSI